MRVDAFDFPLPEDRIALRPAEPRDAARLLVVRPDDLLDRGVLDLPDLLGPGDVLVVNNTRVIPSRLHGRRGEARVEVTLHKSEGGTVWAAFARPARKCRPGDTLVFGDLCAQVVERRAGGEVVLAFDCAADQMMAALETHGEMPLPPYIAGRRAVDAQDDSDYQTAFAAEAGAVAAPTAGLHFTDRLLAALAARGVGREEVTLHVGAGTFLPVKAEDTDAHVMHAEWGRVPRAVAERLTAARAAGGRVVAVGTTSLRLLESAADQTGRIQPFEGDTDIFITPGYRFRAIDRLMTNFHLPRSTLFMLVSAFSGLDRMQSAYAHAVAERYRFYSYGDACLLHPSTPSLGAARG
ncbi:tRNA preQ1(34) S-adenosylmethionine ribosyltransferase-isomerase QueA [Rhodothalassium salexigens]|uniref:tRNA preQ1(34) S-adenosylmethionine ribosyltransferase-isomerase QueA n=1 Tax=Rhodothalassium salexigens TaxID=1086 RepID=UPI0019143268|nr:tRNA preQ1(34) S-adenosylmethionine ribosyltransferase-isomerase QueA [Rhodothalassium salexigens]MBK5912077.1 tRNA preQ1(34) S-adenosylmethionine ribosyltransferase-isomerase QueA [Rhodothalassium salexigens]